MVKQFENMNPLAEFINQFIRISVPQTNAPKQPTAFDSVPI